MTTKRIMRWGIVLFLLAALPVMTAVMAQGQEPDARQAPESIRYEIEPNSPMEQADVIQLNDVITGGMNIRADLDYFKFYVSQPKSIVLIDVERGPNSNLQPALTLYDSEGHVLKTDHRELQDTMIFAVLPTGWYYVLLHDLELDGSPGDFSYNLFVSSPLLISAAAANLGTGTVAGIPFRSEDILAWSDLNNGQERWAMLFDGSDVGVKTLANVATDSTGRILFTTGGNQTLIGLGTVTPWDIIAFQPQFLGEETAGAFFWHLQGRQEYLTTTAEKIDAVQSGFYTGVSTAGTATVPYYMGYNIKLQDEDLTWWSTADEEWYPDFDGSQVTGLAVEDVYAASRGSTIQFLTILGNGTIAGHKVTQKDIFAIGLNDDAWGGYAWRGPDHGWNYKIDAFEWTGW